MRLNTGAYGLDVDLRGGIPSGIIEISGGDASGKTTLGLSILREAQLRGDLTGIVHLDGLPDKEYIYKVGPTETVVVIPERGEVALELVYQLLLRGAKAILIDTVTSVEPRNYNPRFGERDFAARHRLLYHGLSIIRQLAYKKRCSVICLNQIRTNIPSYSFKSPLDSLFQDLSDLRLFLKRKSYETEYGTLAKVSIGYKVNKSLLSTSQSKGSFTLWPEVGIDRNYELLYYLIKSGKLKKSGAYFVPASGRSLGPGYMTASEQIGGDYEHYRNLATYKGEVTT